jgi:hypothetical protein
MAPHPILMHILHDDRTRELEALLVQRRRVDQANAVPAPAAREPTMPTVKFAALYARHLVTSLASVVFALSTN